MHSILQISDLHRSTGEPIDNDTLLSVVLADCDRFSSQYTAPSAIVVSGDLVQGARTDNPSWQEEMRSQFETATDFIGRLCEEVLDGDRSSVAIVQGNHDVCWNTSLASMEKVPKTEYPKDIRKELAGVDSMYRWSWKEQALYRIKDPVKHEQRLSAYWDFFEDFYQNTNLPIPVNRNRGFHFFELVNRRILLAGFESTHGNDHLRFSGALTPGVVGRCALEMRKLEHFYDLRMAVWHHSIYGPPHRDDYLDVNDVRGMIGHGFQLGLHGHQHLAEAASQSVSLGAGQSMAIASSGSLCAGANELPRGVNRQYNYIVLDEDMTSGELHVREMVEGNQFTRKTNGAFLEGKLPLNWSQHLNAAGKITKSADQNLRNLVELVEADVVKGLPSTHTNDLLSFATSTGSYARSVLLRALILEQRWRDISTSFSEPNSADEIIAVIEAAIQLKDFDAADSLISRSELPSVVADDLKTRIQMMKAIS